MTEKLSMSPAAIGSPRRALRPAIALGAILGLSALAGCSSKTGTAQFVNAPTAIATPIGYKSASQNPAVITVRAGADVQLTGEDSDGGNISINSFAWKQTDAPPVPAVDIIYRNASTVSFTAPSVAAGTTLNLQLTVTNALGATGMASVQVKVQPANDSNRFLSLLATPRYFKAALSLAKTGANPGDPIALSADAPVCVTLTPTLTYLTRGGANRAASLAVQSVDTHWSAAIGATAGFPSGAQSSLSYKNPVVSFEMPARNDDPLVAEFNQPGATSTDVSNQLVASDIDTAFVPMSVSAAWGTCASPGTGPAGLDIVLQLEDQFGAPVGAPVTASAGGAARVASSAAPTPSPLTPGGSTQLTPEDFLRVAALGTTNSPIETRESAAAYYAAIDPGSTKTTLTAWLTANCFDAAGADYGAGEAGYSVAHAIYTNNFDLGFGRDMYFANCTGTKTPGNMAAVVINYPTLEAAANKLGAFLAVAMEYTPGPGGGPCFTNPANPATNTGNCFTKFYVFAPDDRTGDFNRVLSANFDHRGQKYIPGACTVCHGGKPHFTPGQAYPSNGNVDAAFMPWDLGSLLFSDTDPAFACNVYASSPACLSVSPSLFTQSAQAPNIKQLNALAWRTYQSPELITTVTPPSSVNRYQAPIDLLTKWYGGDPAAASAHAFDDSATPAAWATVGAAAPNDIYHTVFAHYCRSCHTQNNVPTQQFASVSAFESFLTAGATSALPISSTNIQQLVFHNTEMPLSRLTADRFWVDYDGGQSAAQSLAAYVNTVAAAPPSGQSVAAVPMDSSGNVVPPGLPQFALSSTNPSSPTPLSTGAVLALTRFQGASIDALTQSVFVSTYQWSLCALGAPAAPGDACPGTVLPLVGTPSAASGSGAAPQTGASQPSFATVAPGTYYLTLTAQSDLIGAAPLSATYKVAVAEHDPALTAGAASGSCPSSHASFDGTLLSGLDVTSCLTALGDAGPTGYSLLISADGTHYFNCINTAGCANTSVAVAWAASASSGESIVNGQNTFVPTLTFGFENGASSDATVYYRWCDFDAVCVGSNASIALTHLAASAANLVAYWDPSSANPNYAGGPIAFVPPSGALAISSATTTASSGAMAFSLGGDLIMDPATDAYSFTLAPPSDGGKFNNSAVSLTANGTPSVVQSLASNLSYTPGTSTCVSVDVNGAAITNTVNPTCTTNSGVTFNYTLTDTTLASSVPTTTGLLQIRALATFSETSTVSSVYSRLSTAEGGFTCSTGGCHSTPANVWAMGTDAASTYAHIKAATDGLGNSLVQPGDPLHSAFYTGPCLLKDPDGSNINMNGASYSASAATCLIIYQWILEGGQLD